MRFLCKPYNTKAKLVVKGVQYMKKIFLIILSIFVAIIIVIDVSLFISGSLEAFPTTEQIEKGRIDFSKGSVYSFECYKPRCRMERK